MAEVHTPPGLFLFEVGLDYILGVSIDDYDVQTVKLYSLRRAAS